MVLGLLLSTSVYASTMYCKVDEAYTCNEKGCTKVKSEIFINLDTERKTYQRGVKQKYRENENMRLYPNIKKARIILKWRPKIRFDKGIKTVINSYR